MRPLSLPPPPPFAARTPRLRAAPGDRGEGIEGAPRTGPTYALTSGAKGTVSMNGAQSEQARGRREKQASAVGRRRWEVRAWVRCEAIGGARGRAATRSVEALWSAPVVAALPSTEAAGVVSLSF